MLGILGIAGAIAFFLIAGLHVYWMLAPSVDFSRLINLDKNGKRMNPGKAATLFVALVFLGAGLLPLVSLGIIPLPLPQLAIDIMLILGIAVLLLRGVGGLIGSLVKKQPRDIFDTWNIRLYTWICIFLAVAYLACLLFNH